MSTSPAFQFYPAEFLADENVVLMSNQELGCYIKLMCYCWREGSIPAEVKKIARLCGEGGPAMAELWVAIAPCFIKVGDDPTRRIHPRLEKELQKQIKHRAERSEAGRRGATARWGHEKDGMAQPLAEPMAEPMAKNGSSSSSSSLKTNTPPTPPEEVATPETLKTERRQRIPAAALQEFVPLWKNRYHTAKEYPWTANDTMCWRQLVEAVPEKDARGKVLVAFLSSNFHAPNRHQLRQLVNNLPRYQAEGEKPNQKKLPGISLEAYNALSKPEQHVADMARLAGKDIHTALEKFRAENMVQT